MRFIQLWRRGQTVTALAVVGLIVLAGCAPGGESAASAERVRTLKIDVPVKEPVWASDAGLMLALVEGKPQVAKIDPTVEESSQAKTTISGTFEDVGENLAVNPEAVGNAYLPQPDLGHVAVIDIEDLEKVRTFKAGPSPVRVTTDVGSELLFALAEDGSSVAGVNLETFETLLPPVKEVKAGKEAELEGPARGLAAEFWVTGPGGVALYEGHPTPLHRIGHMSISAGAVAGDLIKVTRVYVGEAETDRLVAVGLNPETHRLAIAAETRLGEPIEYIGTDQKRVFVATRNRLVVLKTENFEGFGDDGFEVVETIDFRRPLEEGALKSAPLSGMAVGPTTERVYLTLEGEPYVLSVAKPDY